MTKSGVENFTNLTLLFSLLCKKMKLRKEYIGHHANKPFRCKNLTLPHVKFIKKYSKYNLCWSECSKEAFSMYVELHEYNIQ